MTQDKHSPQDLDQQETQEWLEALDSLVDFEGADRAQFVIGQVLARAANRGVGVAAGLHTPYANTIPPHQEAKMPDDGSLLQKNTNIMRWNAIAMVMRAGRVDSHLGGHIASYGAIATLYEVGLNHFFKAQTQKGHDGDLVYFQGHSSPGIYARAYLEGRLSKKELDHFRQEALTTGISSYPHPWLMPEFWQFPTVSMGLGPLMAIYQARFLKYLDNRELVDTKGRYVWTFCGDGEMSEPESTGALWLAGREKLDNLTFVISCNLQRLDGPVFGNGQIIQEFEGVFRGAGWNVIKVIHGSNWEPLFAKDTQGLIQKRFAKLVDGQYQHLSSADGAYWREHFFGDSPELAALVADMSDEEIGALQDGGHDPQKVFAAFQAAQMHEGQPTVVLVKTVKGYGMGKCGEARNVTHQTKKMPMEDLQQFRDRFDLPLTEKDLEALHFYKPAKESPEMQYLQSQREKLGGYLPARRPKSEKLIAPALSAFQVLLDGMGDHEISTTMAFVRILSVLLKDKNIKERIVPIVPDESRTFGMEGLFRQIGIYSPFGQQYEPEDRKQLMYYREDKKGQYIQEGITEAGAMSEWIAAATSYSTSHFPMIPFLIYYSMFGFQRFGDLAWAAGDKRARGFILGATAGRTTLAGEGLQHQDGHNIMMFNMVPNCVTYDPTFAYELAVIVQHGLKRMYEDQEDVYYYLTVMNENYQQPAMPKGVEDDIIKGMYCFSKGKKTAKHRVQLLGSGTILLEVIKAAELLQKEFDVGADVWSVTSFCECHNDMQSVARYHRLHPNAKTKKQSHVAQCLKSAKGPVIAATDYIKLFAEQIRADIPNTYHVLGTDGFGRSDTRAALRDFFEVNANMIAYTAIKALVDDGELPVSAAEKALTIFDIDAGRVDPDKH